MTLSSSIIIVTLHAGPRLERCLELVRPEAERHRTQIVVVANGRKAWRQMGRAAPVGVDVVRSPLNLGLAGGLHLGRLHARGDVLVILQDDSEVSEGWLAPLLAALDEQPSLGLVGSLNTTSDGTPSECGRVLAHRDVPSAVDVVLSAPPRLVYVELCNSASLAVRAKTWDGTGGPDRRLFPLWTVDFDLSMRALADGWQLAVDPRSVIRHDRRGSLTGPRRAVIERRNWLRWLDRWTPVVDLLPANAPTAEETLAQGLERAARVPHPLAGVPYRRVPAAGPWRLYAEGSYDQIDLALRVRLLQAKAWVPDSLKVAVRRGLNRLR